MTNLVTCRVKHSRNPGHQFRRAAVILNQHATVPAEDQGV